MDEYILGRISKSWRPNLGDSGEDEEREREKEKGKDGDSEKNEEKVENFVQSCCEL